VTSHQQTIRISAIPARCGVLISPTRNGRIRKNREKKNSFPQALEKVRARPFPTGVVHPGFESEMIVMSDAK
jgi:hypothetical protein